MGLPQHNIVTDSTTIQAPIARCFALSTRVELVKETLGMRLVGGVTSGHIEAGSRVVWKGWKFGLPTTHRTLITGFAAPHAEEPGVQTAWFQDSQEQGRFAFFQHDHYFRETLNGVGNPQTLLEDKVRFALPFGPLGRLAAKLLLAPHIRKLVRQRYERLRGLAESDEWRAFIEDEGRLSCIAL